MNSHQTKNIKKEMGIIKKTQIEILELKSTIIEIKNSLESFNNRFLSRQKESVNLKIGEMKLSSLWSRKKKGEEQQERNQTGPKVPVGPHQL